MEKELRKCNMYRSIIRVHIYCIGKSTHGYGTYIIYDIYIYDTCLFSKQEALQKMKVSFQIGIHEVRMVLYFIGMIYSFMGVSIVPRHIVDGIILSDNHIYIILDPPGSYSFRFRPCELGF